MFKKEDIHKKGVYCLTSPSGKKYVGIATGKSGVYHRWMKYKNLNCKEQPKLYYALKKYGPENFKYEIVLETDDADNAKRSEMYLIDVWDLQNPEKGYNSTAGGDGRTWSEDDKRKYSETMSGSNHPMYGKKHSEETKKAWSIKRKGVSHSGWKHSEDAKNKMRGISKPKGSNSPSAKTVTILDVEKQQTYIGCIVELAKVINVKPCVLYSAIRRNHKRFVITNADTTAITN